MNLSIAISANPERSLSPCKPGIAAGRRRDAGKHTAGFRIDLLDAILGDLKQMPTVERRPGMRGDLNRAERFSARRIEGVE
jgi:hypothetical protein